MIDFTKQLGKSERRVFDEGLRTYFQKIYLYMSGALLATAVSAFAVFSFEPLARMIYNISPMGQIMGLTGIGMIFAFAPIAFVMYFYMKLHTMSIQKARALFWTYAVLIGVSLSSLVFTYTGTSITRTFFITASVFGGMSLYGYTTKKDLSSLGSFLMMGIWGIIIASLVNMFMRSSAMDFAISLIGVLIFTGMIAYDTQKLKALYYSGGGATAKEKLAIMGALQLYMDFVNLFIYLLRFLGSRKD